MIKKKNKSNAPVKREYCEIEPKECDGTCCYAKKKGGK